MLPSDTRRGGEGWGEAEISKGHFVYLTLGLASPLQFPTFYWIQGLLKKGILYFFPEEGVSVCVNMYE